MTRTALDADILRFCTHLLADHGIPEIKTEVIRMMPLNIHVGIIIPDVQPEIMLASCTTEGMRDATLATWPPSPGGFMVNCPPKSIGIAADDKHVIFDLVFYSVKIELDDNLKPKA